MNWRITLVVLALCAIYLTDQVERIQEMKEKYDFTVFVRTPLGMEAYQNIGVDHVEHMNDGAICFRDIQNDVYGCEKATDYTLKPQGSEQ